VTSVAYVSLFIVKTSQQGGTSIETIGAIVAVVIAVGTVLWGAYRFYKGRVYRPRLEPGITGTVALDGSNVFLTWKASLKNVGSSKVDIAQKGSGLRVYTARAATVVVKAQAVQWDLHATVPVFVKHGWIECGETIEDANSLNIPRDAALSLKLDLRIVSEGT
jgi:heme/copper-type cytochrome/quinol oxidase subunit 2